MSEESEIGRWVRQRCPLSPTLFDIYLEDLMKNFFLSTGVVNIVGRRIKCIRFTDDMVLLAEDEKMLKNMPMELNDRCEEYGMKIHKNKTKTWLSEETQRRYILELNMNPLNMWTASNTWGAISIAT